MARGSVVRWKAIPLSGQYVVRRLGGIFSKTRHLTSAGKGLSSKATADGDRRPLLRSNRQNRW